MLFPAHIMTNIKAHIRPISTAIFTKMAGVFTLLIHQDLMSPCVGTSRCSGSKSIFSLSSTEGVYSYQESSIYTLSRRIECLVPRRGILGC